MSNPIRMTPEEFNHLFNVANQQEQEQADRLQALKEETERARADYQKAKAEATRLRSELSRKQAEQRAKQAETLYNEKREKLRKQQEKKEHYDRAERVAWILQTIAVLIAFIGNLVILLIILSM